MLASPFRMQMRGLAEFYEGSCSVMRAKNELNREKSPTEELTASRQVKRIFPVQRKDARNR